jgi:hypothetical protein
VLEGHHFVCKTFFFEGADESLLDGDAAMPANCAEPGANVVVVAPFEVGDLGVEAITLGGEADAMDGAVDGNCVAYFSGM